MICMLKVAEHVLVPKHEILPEEEKKKLLERLHVTEAELPKIFIDDPAIKHLKPKPGDVIKMTRRSPTAGETFYYRVVIERKKEVEELEELEETEEEVGEG